MIDNVEKTIPSEDISLAWLAGIIDGEGSIGIYNTCQGQKLINLSIVNSDEGILKKVEEIYKKLNVFYCRYLHTRKKLSVSGFLSTQPCYVITVRRRDEFEKLAPLLIPLLNGKKKKTTQEVLEYLKQHPRKVKPVYYCSFCKKAFGGRKRQFCSLDCWHKFSVGEKNPNFRHGKYIARND